MHRDHEIFLRAIRRGKKVKVTFFSKEPQGTSVRLCGPIFYSPSVGGIESGCYYLWDFDTDVDNHFLSFAPSRIVSMELAEESFELVEFFTSKEQVDGSHCDNGRNSSRTKKEILDGENMQEL